MSDELDPTTSPMTTPLFDPLLGTPAATSLPAARIGMNRTRQIAGVAALAAGVAITAGIAVASRDDTAATSTETASEATTDASGPPDAGTAATADTPVAAGELLSLDAGSATSPAVTGTTGDTVDADGDGDGGVGPGDLRARAFDGARPEGGRGHGGDLGDLGEAREPDRATAGSAMPAPDASSQGS